jgi:signal transduction histidine kinase
VEGWADEFVRPAAAGVKRYRAPAPRRADRRSSLPHIGQHFSRFYTDEDRANGEPRRALETATRQGRYEKEGWRVRKDGTRFWANVVIDPIRAPDGTLLGFAKVTRDITERREAQEQLERTRETLFRVQKMEAIGRLTGGVAHNFNNLLTAVIGSLELLHKRVGDDARASTLIDNASASRRDPDTAHARLRPRPGVAARTGRSSHAGARHGRAPAAHPGIRNISSVAFSLRPV